MLWQSICWDCCIIKTLHVTDGNEQKVKFVPIGGNFWFIHENDLEYFWNPSLYFFSLSRKIIYISDLFFFPKACEYWECFQAGVCSVGAEVLHSFQSCS